MTECDCVIFEGEIVTPVGCEMTGEVTVPVIYSAPPLEEVILEVTENGHQEIVPTGGHYGLSRVSVTTNVQPPLEEVTINISSGSRTVEPSEGFYGISKATVNVVPDPWKPNPSWWDIEAIVQTPENQEYPYKCIQLLPDDEVVSSFSGGVAYKTSDGAYYAQSSATHTWDPAQDKICMIDGESTYKTRWVIVYYAAQNIASFTVQRDCLYFVMDGIRPTSVQLSFKRILISFDLINGADFANVTSGYTMFRYCKSLYRIPLIDTSNIISFESFFEECSKLKQIPKLKTGKGTTFSRMFFFCAALNPIPELDTRNGIRFSGFCSYCYSLESFPLIDTSKAEDLESMFAGCWNLTSIPKLETGQSTRFTRMLDSCYVLNFIPEINLSNGAYIDSIFGGCYALVSAKIIIATSGVNLTSAPLNRESLLYTLENLPETPITKKLTLGSANLNKLTNEEKAIATNKGWTLS